MGLSFCGTPCIDKRVRPNFLTLLRTYVLENRVKLKRNERIGKRCERSQARRTDLLIFSRDNRFSAVFQYPKREAKIIGSLISVSRENFILLALSSVGTREMYKLKNWRRRRYRRVIEI